MALKIIGAGFGRTGTLSLKTALERLGFPCYHMVECFPRGVQHWRLWEQALAGNPRWDAIFDGFTATVDFPACTSFEALAEYYDDAKVILTLRDPGNWYQSTQDTIFARPWLEYLPGSPAGAFMKATINDYFDDRMHDRDFLIQRFSEHTAAVKSLIPADRLLLFEVKQGWGPLCDFLEVAEPGEAFPHINDTAATQALIKSAMENGIENIFR